MYKLYTDLVGALPLTSLALARVATLSQLGSGTVFNPLDQDYEFKDRTQPPGVGR